MRQIKTVNVKLKSVASELSRPVDKAATAFVCVKSESITRFHSLTESNKIHEHTMHCKKKLTIVTWRGGFIASVLQKNERDSARTKGDEVRLWPVKWWDFLSESHSHSLYVITSFHFYSAQPQPSQQLLLKFFTSRLSAPRFCWASFSQALMSVCRSMNKISRSSG